MPTGRQFFYLQDVDRAEPAYREAWREVLAFYQARYGDWRELFRSVERLEKVSKADIRRVASQTFTPENRTVGIIETAAQTGASKGDAP